MKKIESNKKTTKLAVTCAACAVGSYGAGGLLMYFSAFGFASEMYDIAHTFMNAYVVIAFLWPLVIFLGVKLFITDILG